MARVRLVGELLDPCLGDALRKQGFARSTLILGWPDIVGDRLAGFCAPGKIDWPRRAPTDEVSQPATLVVRVESAFALELQHMAPVVIDRINAHLGWRCIGRLVLKQGPLPPRPLPRKPRAVSSPALVARVKEAVAGVDDERLEQALRALGEAVLTSGSNAGGGVQPIAGRTKS